VSLIAFFTLTAVLHSLVQYSESDSTDYHSLSRQCGAFWRLLFNSTYAPNASTKPKATAIGPRTDLLFPAFESGLHSPGNPVTDCSRLRLKTLKLQLWTNRINLFVVCQSLWQRLATVIRRDPHARQKLCAKCEYVFMYFSDGWRHPPQNGDAWTVILNVRTPSAERSPPKPREAVNTSKTSRYQRHYSNATVQVLSASGGQHLHLHPAEHSGRN